METSTKARTQLAEFQPEKSSPLPAVLQKALFIARQLQERCSLLCAALGRGGGAALARLMPGNRAKPQALPQVPEAVAIALQQVALRPVLQPADSGDDHAHDSGVVRW